MGKKKWIPIISSLVLAVSLFSGVTLSNVSAQDVNLQQTANAKGVGTEHRNWVTGPASAPISSKRYQVDPAEEISITMRDGVVLKAHLYVPEKVGSFPTVVMLNGYGHNSSTGQGMDTNVREMAERGYAALHVTMRGTKPSEGEANLYNKFGQDGYDVIEWAAKQPWSDGNVGTIGVSLLGINQWLTAKELPPHLKAIAPEIACTNCYDYLWYPGGMLPGPGRLSRGEPEYSSAIQHRNFDSWWRERTVLTEDLKTIADHGIAALISGGWNDYITPGNVNAFKEYSALGGKSKLMVGPGAHSTITNLLPYSYRDYQQVWFDHYLKGIKNGIDKEDSVLIYVQGPNQWRFEKAWPIPDTRTSTMYLSAQKSGSINSLNDGSLTAVKPRAKNSSETYGYSPTSGPFLPTMRSNTNGILKIDQAPYEQKTVTWTTGALADPTEVTGTVNLSFWASANAPDTDFVLQITDVAPDGTSKQVTTGYLNASRSKSRSNPTPLTPGKVERYTIESLPTSYVFQPGHRLRLSLAGGSQALKEQVGPQGPGLNPQAATVTVYQDAKHSSSLKIPVIGKAFLPTESHDQNENSEEND